MSHRRSLLMKRPSSGFEFGNALVFDGVDDIVNFTGSSSTGVWSLSYWFKWDGTQTGVPLGGVSATKYVGYMATTKLKRITVRMSGTNFFDFPDSHGDDNWHHVLITNDNTVGMRCYKDGVESTSGLLTAGNTYSWTFDRLGQRNGSLKYKGVLDEVCYKEGYTGTLTDAQDLYNSGAGVDSSTILTSPTQYFKLNESGTDTTAINDGSGGDGTLSNFPASGMWVAH